MAEQKDTNTNPVHETAISSAENIAALLSENGLFRTLLDNLHEGVYFVDTERRIQYWNIAAERISGFKAKEVVGRSCMDNILTHINEKGDDICVDECPLIRCFEAQDSSQVRLYLRHKEGHRIPVQINSSAIRDDKGEIIGGLETFYDASSVVEALDEIQRLRELSLLCPLTNVGNRRYTEAVLTERLEEMKRHKTALTVLFLDIDHFKDFNDTHGHAVGDVVLKMTARTLSNAIRAYDFVGRWGGEEFVIILPRADREEAASMAERLRMLVSRSTRTESGNRLKVTVSIGAHVCRPDETLESAIDAADRLMYQSKQDGRNRVTLSTAD